jgi:hypothetical protein
MFLCGSLALAKAPASAPAGTTGLCKDGSYTSAASKSGACSGHDGVKKWYGPAAEANSSAAVASSSTKGTSSAKSTSKSKSEAIPAAAPESTNAEEGTTSGKSKKKTETSAPAAASSVGPAAATGMCKDGTSTSAASKSGACSGHGGVKEWYATAGAAAPAAPAAMTKAMPATPATRAAPPAQAEAPAKTTSTPPATPAPGGGRGQVWVNKPSKVYHCPNDQWYGKTKDGAYMSEANAIAQGYRADHGRACQ